MRLTPPKPACMTRMPKRWWWLIASLVPIFVLLLSTRGGTVDPTGSQASAVVELAPVAADPAIVREVLFKHLEHNEKLKGELGTTIYLSLLCIGLTIVTLMQKRRHALQIQGVDVPVNGLHAAIGVIMTFLWFKFMFTFDQLLTVQTDITHCLRWLKIVRDDSMLARIQSLARGSQLVDAWLHTFEPAATSLRGPADSCVPVAIAKLSPELTIGGVAAAIGLAHASPYALLEEAGRNIERPNRRAVAVVGILRALLLGCIALPYVPFEFEHGHQWFSLLASICFFAGVCGFEALHRSVARAQSRAFEVLVRSAARSELGVERVDSCESAQGRLSTS
jgi:hypothetical protein